MSSENEINFLETLIAKRPRITSYDSGFEHSLEHLIGVRQLVEEADREMFFAASELDKLLTTR